MAEISDIISGCARNDPKYQRIVYDKYRGYAFKIVFRYIYHYDKAVDVVTDGFIKAFTHFGAFQATPSPGEDERLLMGWLKRIMINCSIDHLRRSSMLPEIGGIPNDVWDFTDRQDDADQLSLYKDLIMMIKQLPPKYRAILNMHLIDGYSYREIADMLHIPINTCRSDFNRAKGLLIEIINKSEQTKYAGHRT